MTCEEFRALQAAAADDPQPLIENAFWITTKGLPGQPPLTRLVLNKPQQRVHGALMQMRAADLPPREITLKARQPGVSTLGLAELLATALCRPHTMNMLIAHVDEAAEKLFRRILFMVERLPPDLRPRMRPPRKDELYFEAMPCSDGDVPLQSSISVATASGREVWRSQTLTSVLMSEYARFPYPEATLLGVMQSVAKSPGTLVLIESTAQGMGNSFHTQYVRAEAGESAFVAVFIPWFDCPDSTMAAPADFEPDEEEWAIKRAYGLTNDQLQWRRYTIATDCQGDIDRFNQEHPTCLVGETRVSTERGLIRLDAAHVARTAETGSIVAWGPQPEAPLWCLRTVMGREITGTAHHPVRCVDDSWCFLAQLTPGTQIRLMRPVLPWRTPVVTWPQTPTADVRVTGSVDLARWLGYFVGDGSLSGYNGSLVIDARDKDVIEELSELTQRCWGVRVYPRPTGWKNGGTELRWSSRDVAEVLEGLGVAERRGPRGDRCRRVAVPEIIWRGNEEQVAAFLSGLFEADGSAARAPGICFFAKDPAFTRDVQLLLLALGIPSRWRLVKKSGTDHTGCDLTISSEAADRFVERVGFRSARKRAKMARRSPKRPGRPRIPIHFTDTVASVECVGRGITYDLTVEPTHVFGANGIETHNTASGSFLATGLPAFDAQRVSLMYEKARTREPERGEWTERGFLPMRKGRLALWARPIAGHEYVIGADIATGIEGGDLSAACVFDRTTSEQVAEWAGYMTPIDFAQVLLGLGRWYDNALLAPEVNTHGYAVLEELKRSYYENIHRWQRVDRIKNTVTMWLGWETSFKSRGLMIDSMDWAIRKGEIMLWSLELLREMQGFQYVSRRRAEGIDHDDRLFAAMIAYRVHLENPLAATGMPPFVAEPVLTGAPPTPEVPLPARNVDRQVWEEVDDEMRTQGTGRRPAWQEYGTEPEPDPHEKPFWPGGDW